MSRGWWIVLAVLCVLAAVLPVSLMIWWAGRTTHKISLPAEEPIHEAPAVVLQPPATVLLTHGRHVLDGRVTRNGRPVGFAKVELRLVSTGHPSAMIPIHTGLRRPAEGPSEIADLTTRADGKFRFAGLATGVPSLARRSNSM